MIRIGAFLVGLFFSGWLLVSFVMGAYAAATTETTESAEYAFHEYPKDVAFASDGPLGKFDNQQLQRGFQVYKEVCAACHGLQLVAFRNLTALGYNEDEVKAIADQWLIEAPSIDPNTGEPATRKNIASDYFPEPFANETAARAANNNALPPDLSLMTKARHDGGAYIYSLLTGYQNPPAELAEQFPDSMPGTGLYYNPYFANLNIAMAPPIIADGQVTYGPGNPPATVEQMSKDVSAFLIWTAEPTMDKRKQTGWAVLIFLLIATALGYMAYRNVWADRKH